MKNIWGAFAIFTVAGALVLAQDNQRNRGLLFSQALPGGRLAPAGPSPGQRPWTPVAPPQAPSPAVPGPVQPGISPNTPLAPNPGPGPGPGQFFNGPVLVVPPPPDPAAPPPLEMPPQRIAVEYASGVEYRRVGKSVENMMDEAKDWHSVWGRVWKKPSVGGLIVNGFYCTRKVDSPAFIGSRGAPVGRTFMLTNCPDSHTPGQGLRKVYRAKSLGDVVLKDEVTGSNFIATVFDYGRPYVPARAGTNAASSRSGARL